MQTTPPLYHEDLVPDIHLPDPLVREDGTPVTDAKGWMTFRRPELLTLFEHHVYGRSPAPPATLRAEVGPVAEAALNGLATRKEVTIWFGERTDEPKMDLLIYLPRQLQRPVPLFMGLNFRGNHTIQPDPEIPLPTSWVPNDPQWGVDSHSATDAARGSASSRWPVELILDHGYGLATIYCGDIDPDFDDGFQNGVHGLFARDDSHGDAWGTLSAWAWGLSRTMDVLEQDADIDIERVAVIGHSRLGKTALWAGASDPRFALVISNNSGCGGAALSRRRFGETVRRINTTFPHWFCTNFRRYNDREEALPIDQHELISMIAPRPVYIASAAEDLWADPQGEFLSARAADPVYRLLGTKGLPAVSKPTLNTPVWGAIGYHLRSGGHAITPYDWTQYLAFADHHLKR